MGDQWMNDCLVTYIKNDVFDRIDNEFTIQRFQNINLVEGNCKVHVVWEKWEEKKLAF